MRAREILSAYADADEGDVTVVFHPEASYRNNYISPRHARKLARVLLRAAKDAEKKLKA